LKANRALRQIPFNGKKLKPAKIRKDFWRPMAMIQFPGGLGHVGRSVFHIMREFRMAHETNWSDDLLRDPETNRTLTKHERGKRLNNQKANSIADMAAVLGGVGKGNKIFMSVEQGGENVVAAGDGYGKDAGLVKATVFWMNGLDQNYAVEWSPNVTHALFEESIVFPRDDAELLAEEEALAEEAEAAEAKVANGAAPVDPASTQSKRDQDTKAP
jgi:hypothetical protein